MVWKPPSKTKNKLIFYGQDVVRKKSVKYGENNIAQQLGNCFSNLFWEFAWKLKAKPTQGPGMQHSQDNLVVQELHQHFLFKLGSIYLLFANFCKIAIFFIPDS